jgi:transcription elongation factor Elf1
MAHAKLSASGSKRWLTCTPSARLEEQFPGDTTSVYAEEGTLAHSLGEAKLSLEFGKITKAKYSKEVKKIEKHELYDHTMPDYVDLYVNYVIERFNEAKKRSSDAIIALEQRLDFSHLVPEGFGTGDTVIIADGTMEIIDLKYGKGVEVDSEDNTQMMLYALGALNEYEFLYDIQDVQMTIVQPRLDSISTSIISVRDLYEWAYNYLVPRAKLAWDGEGEFLAGDHCKFCKARYNCKARADQNLELAKYEFATCELLSDVEIADILTRVDNFKSWVKDIEEFSLNEAIKGKKWPGFKLVEGRSNRAYVDEIQVADKLKSCGYDEAVLFEKKLYGITAMEKTIGKKQFGTILEGLVIKPQGKPTLAPESDKRQELNLNSAVEDFKLENENGGNE